MENKHSTTNGTALYFPGSQHATLLETELVSSTNLNGWVKNQPIVETFRNLVETLSKSQLHLKKMTKKKSFERVSTKYWKVSHIGCFLTQLNGVILGRTVT